MKRSRYSEDQIIGILKEHQSGMSAGDLCRKHGISDATFNTWRKKFAGRETGRGPAAMTVLGGRAYNGAPGFIGALPARAGCGAK